MSAAEVDSTAPDGGEHAPSTSSASSSMADTSSDTHGAGDASEEGVVREAERAPQRRSANLLSLPPELHYEIFEHLQNRKAGKRPICRAFWPMTRRNLFRSVRLSTPERLQRFANLIQPMHRTYSDPSLLQEVSRTARLIKVLAISVRPPKSRVRTSAVSDASDNAEVSVTPHVAPNTDDLSASSHVRAILSQATHVRRLTMSGPRALEFLVPAKSGWLHGLEQLELKIRGGQAQHWNAECLSRLRHFRRLKELYLDLSKLGESALPPTASSTTLRPVPQIHQLHLHLRTCTIHAEIATCMTLFSGIKKLVVDLNIVEGADNVDAREVIDLGDLLQAVPASHLSNLTISCPDVDDIDPEDAEAVPGLTIEADLGRFNCLTRLSLCYNTFHRAGDLFDLLAMHVPRLQYLALGRYAYVRAAKLLSFIRQKGGPGRALKELECDIFDGSFEWRRVPTANPEDPRVVDGTFDLDEMWELPGWQSDFTFAQAREVFTAGHEVGVRITGDLLWAIYVETRRAREQAFLDERRDE